MVTGGFNEDGALKATGLYMWVACKEVQESLEDNLRSRRPVSNHNDETLEIFKILKQLWINQIKARKLTASLSPSVRIHCRIRSAWLDFAHSRLISVLVCDRP